MAEQTIKIYQLSNTGDCFLGVAKEEGGYTLLAGFDEDSIAAEIVLTKEEIRGLYEFAFGENQ